MSYLLFGVGKSSRYIASRIADTARCRDLAAEVESIRGNSAWRKVMNEAETRAALVHHWSDMANQDVVHEIYHEDVVLEFPQGGERLVGLANVRAMREAYPAQVAISIERMRGAGRLWVTEVTITYDGQRSMNAVNIMEFRDNKVAHETIYFGEPWEPPAWRAQWVERMANGVELSRAGV
jgi:hypothetical protein